VGEIYTYLKVSIGAFLTITGCRSGAQLPNIKMLQTIKNTFLIVLIRN
jgi:hypothetical protein